MSCGHRWKGQTATAILASEDKTGSEDTVSGLGFVPEVLVICVQALRSPAGIFKSV